MMHLFVVHTHKQAKGCVVQEKKGGSQYSKPKQPLSFYIIMLQLYGSFLVVPETARTSYGGRERWPDGCSTGHRRTQLKETGMQASKRGK